MLRCVKFWFICFSNNNIKELSPGISEAKRVLTNNKHKQIEVMNHLNKNRKFGTGLKTIMDLTKIEECWIWMSLVIFPQENKRVFFFNGYSIMWITSIRKRIPPSTKWYGELVSKKSFFPLSFSILRKRRSWPWEVIAVQ